jgi:hypothetical protein
MKNKIKIWNYKTKLEVSEGNNKQREDKCNTQVNGTHKDILLKKIDAMRVCLNFFG